MIAAQAETEALQAELRLQLLNNASLASMGELAAALAHELNQPLTAISNFVNACRQMIRSDDVAVPEDLIALMDDAVSESQRAGEDPAAPAELRSAGRAGARPARYLDDGS